MARRQQNPWDNDPVVDISALESEAPAPAPQAVPQAQPEAQRGYQVVNSTFTQESPDELRAAGYEQGPDGNWFRYLEPEQSPQPVPYASDPALTDSQLAAAAEAERRVLGTELGSGGGALYQGLLLGFSDELSGEIARGGQAASNLVRTLTNQPIEIQSGDLRDAMVATSRNEQERFARERPVSNAALQLAGGALTGGYGAARSGVANAVRTGAAYGGAYGFGSGEGSVIDRLPGAAVGALAGGVTGGAVQAGANIATPYVQRLAGIAGVTARPPRIRRNASPEQRSAARMVETMDGPAALAERDRLRALGLNPSVMDVAGNTTERLVRTAAGPAGPGAELAVTNQLQRTANLKPEIMAVTQGISPDPRSATVVREGLEQTRSTLAEQQYRPAYATPVPVTEQLMGALADEPGRAALRRARQAAVARQDAAQVAEIDELLRRAQATDSPSPIVLENRALPSSESLATPPPPTPDQMRRYGRVERVPLSAARRGQSWMDWDRVNRGERPGDMVQGFGDRPLAVRRENGEYIILDGNHRTVRAIEAGDIDAEMYVIDARDYAPDVAGRPRVERPYDPAEDDALLRELGVEPSPRRGFEVSAATLDRTRIAMNNRAEALARNASGGRDIAGGLRGRASQIDAALESVPELAPARETYRNLSGAIEILDNRPSVFNTDPRDFAGWVRELTPEQRQAAVIGIRQDVLDQLGGQRQAGTGALDQLAQAPYARQNLEALLGQEEAAQYLGSIQERVRQAQRAARVSPNTNSQTFGRSMDEQTMGVAERLGALSDGAQAVTGNIGALARTIDRIRARATMSPEEREAIVQLGIGSADELERIVQLAESARRAGRRPPREVRAWITETRNVLGAQSPVAQQLERLLLASPVAAEEQSQ